MTSSYALLILTLLCLVPVFGKKIAHSIVLAVIMEDYIKVLPLGFGGLKGCSSDYNLVCWKEQKLPMNISFSNMFNWWIKYTRYLPVCMHVFWWKNYHKRNISLKTLSYVVTWKAVVQTQLCGGELGKHILHHQISRSGPNSLLYLLQSYIICCLCHCTVFSKNDLSRRQCSLQFPLCNHILPHETAACGNWHH